MADRIRPAPSAPGVERLEAHLHGRPFAPHRHDTYAIGITLAGVQSFRFRGETWHCLPGQAHILHPDELHDGRAGTEAGFAYRIAYLDPALVQRALGGRPLPFVAQPVVDGAGLRAATALWDLETAVDEAARVDLIVAAADLLVVAAGGALPTGRLDLPALERVRTRIAADPAGEHPLAELEREAGLTRWTLARQFRAAFGTSPSRYRTLRRLDAARRLVTAGARLAEAAAATGFADQSHMTRQWKRAWGLTPARWAAALAAE